MNSMSSAEGSVDSLPEELILEVFLRLARKSLLRSKCVSKGLRDSISSPIFKKRYDLFHNSFTDFAVLIPEGDLMFSMDFHLPGNLYFSKEKEVSIPHNKPTRFTECCKGIVCLSVGVPGSYILLNPFNGTFKFVEGSDLCQLKGLFCMGFGYDYDADDYKIVLVYGPGRHCNIKYVNVYSLKRDSWEQVAREFRPGLYSHFNGICVQSAIHWLWLGNCVYSCIAAFDLETKALRSLPLPPLNETHILKLGLTLYDFGGRLCVSVKPTDPDSSTILWVMEDYGVETSWTPLFTIVNSIQVIGYFPMRDSVRLLCFGLDSRLWSWLNTQDGSSENIQIHKLPGRKKGYYIHGYAAKSWVCVRSPLRLPCS